MKEEIRRFFLDGVSDPVAWRNRTREVLQAYILESLQGAGAMVPLAFQGGTALRFLYSMRRYSEDLDFALERPDRAHRGHGRYDPSVGRLILLLVGVPLLELALLIEIGRFVGTVPTIGLILFTGALGAFLTRRQGLAVLRQVQAEVTAGRLPAGQLVDGLIILLAAALLITPGVLTDAIGLFCLVPAGRRIVKAWTRRWLERAIRTGRVKVSVDFRAGFGDSRTMRNVTPRKRNPQPPTEALTGGSDSEDAG